MTQEEIIEEIRFNGMQEIDVKEIVKFILESNRETETIEHMLRANEYFLVRNTNILQKDTGDIGMSNKILSSALYRLSVEQKVNYAFNNDLVVNFENISEDSHNDTLFETYKTEFDKFLSIENKNTIINMATDSINKGIGWAYLTIGDDANLILQDFEPETIYPAWENRQHNHLSGLVRDYKVKLFKDGDAETVNKVDYFDAYSMYKFIDAGNGDLMIDIQSDANDDNTFNEYDPNITLSHFINNGRGDSWGRVPFIWLKSNQDELPLLNVIISYLDAYDELASKSVDTLIDDIDAILLLKGVTTNQKELAETRDIIKQYKILSLKESGDANYLTVNSDISAIQNKLESLYKNIMQFSSTVDTNDVKIGTNNSGVALKSMYQNLDIYCNGLERQLKMTFHNIKYFFDRFLELKGFGNTESFKDFKISVALDRDMLINEAELINNVRLMEGNVSQETLDEYNPLVLNHELENERRENEILRNNELEAKLAYPFDTLNQPPEESDDE